MIWDGVFQNIKTRVDTVDQPDERHLTPVPSTTKLDAKQIVDLLTQPCDDRRQSVRRLYKSDASSLIDALTLTRNTHARQILCDVLGFRHERTAVPVLVEMLRDASAGVRASAADALGKIRDRAAGPALETLLRTDSDSGVRTMCAAALGAVRHVDAIPLLIVSVKDPWIALRGCAAWSLGYLRAAEAEAALKEALQTESDDGTAGKMIDALKRIRVRRRH